MNNKLIMQSLPLVAAVLGNKYGVKVNIGGAEAFTDGNIINLPSLPLDCDETLIGLARGYIDHESAHIRETNFDELKKANLTPLEMNIWNSIEDWRVEGKLSSIFPGCRGNFHWLIRHLFDNPETHQTNNRSPPASLIPDWILLTVRSWHIPDLSVQRDKDEFIIESQYPGLPDKIKSVLHEVRSKCSTTGDSIHYAKKIVSLLNSQTNENIASQSPKNQGLNPPEKLPKEGAVSVSSDAKNQCSANQNQLEKLIHARTDELPKGMGEVLQKHLTNGSSAGGEDKVCVAVVGKRYFNTLDNRNSHELKKSTTALKTRLQGLLQSVLLKRSHIARKGRLDNMQLYKVAISDPRMFIKPVEKQGLNTAVHILIDCSGSMKHRMRLTAKICYALAKALGSIKGVNVGVTAFPADPPIINGSKNFEIPAVCPVVKHGERIHSKFHTRASGCTPMGEAIWWVLQQMVQLKEYRKIVLVLSDGSPDNLPNTIEAISQGQKLGFEFYGIGIETDGIKRILPNSSRGINNLSELAPAIFKIMKTVFTIRNNGR